MLSILQSEISKPEIKILLGPRQVGKTTLLRQLEEHAKALGHTTHFFDLEQPEILAQFNDSSAQNVRKIRNSGQIVFIDEFQYISNVSKILKAIYDFSPKPKIFCSGSSSLEIHKHLKESLAGRRLLFNIYPLQYAEIKESRPDFSLEDFLCYGGMPAVASEEAKDRKQLLLAELLSAYILKDIKALVKEENLSAFNHLLYLLAQNQGSVLSVHSLANEIKMSVKAVGRYLDILEQTYVNFRVYSFSTNLGNELKKSFKTYLYDLGIRNALLKDFSALEERQDKGFLLEGFVFLKLHAGMKPNMELRFWRTKAGDEVDFIVLKNRKPYPVEVKAGDVSQEIPGGLRRFLLRYPRTDKAWVIHQGPGSQCRSGDCLVYFVPLEEFAGTGLMTIN